MGYSTKETLDRLHSGLAELENLRRLLQIPVLPFGRLDQIYKEVLDRPHVRGTTHPVNTLLDAYRAELHGVETPPKSWAVRLEHNGLQVSLALGERYFWRISLSGTLPGWALDQGGYLALQWAICDPRAKGKHHIDAALNVLRQQGGFTLDEACDVARRAGVGAKSIRLYKAVQITPDG